MHTPKPNVLGRISAVLTTGMSGFPQPLALPPWTPLVRNSLDISSLAACPHSSSQVGHRRQWGLSHCRLPPGQLPPQVVHVVLRAIDIVLHQDFLLLELGEPNSRLLLHHRHVLFVVLQRSNSAFFSLAARR